jgi:hypothetical protein
MRGGQEVCAALHHDQFGLGRVDEQFDFLLGVGDAVDYVFCSLCLIVSISLHSASLHAIRLSWRQIAKRKRLYSRWRVGKGKGVSHMQPHNRTSHIKQPAMQPIPISKINRCHPGPPPPIIPGVIRLDGLAPEIPHVLPHVLAEADVDQEVAVLVVRLEVGRGCVGGPCLHGLADVSDAIPAA